MRRPNKQELKIKHLRNLTIIFEIPFDEMKVIFQQLKSIEMNGRDLAVKYCNGEIESDSYENEIDKIKIQLRQLTSKTDLLKNFYLNGDPRGYFLKLNDDFVRSEKIQIETDWGGYGILCPEGI